MAAAANITGTAEEKGPNIFEIVSQQGFAHALKPAFLHIIKKLAENYPEGKLPMFYRNFDEIYLTFDAWVQWHYILTRKGTLSEAFYSFERTGGGRRRIWLSCVCTVILPYVWNKLDKKLLENEENDGGRRMGKFYHYLKALMELGDFFILLCYTFGFMKSHNMLFLLLGLRLQHVSGDRDNLVEDLAEDKSLWGTIRRFPSRFLNTLGESVMFGVEIGSFFMQFLEWWENDPKRKSAVLTSLPVPAQLSEKDDNFIKFPEKEINRCPVCRRKFKNPTAVSTSGIVYCYGCISPYIKEHGKCPVTSLAVTDQNLIRVFA